MGPTAADFVVDGLLLIPTVSRAGHTEKALYAAFRAFADPRPFAVNRPLAGDQLNGNAQAHEMRPRT